MQRNSAAGSASVLLKLFGKGTMQMLMTPLCMIVAKIDVNVGLRCLMRTEKVVCW